MSELQYTNYIVPTVPVYAYRYYVENHDEWRKGAKPIYKIEIAPVVAFGCGLDEYGYNVTAALILEEGSGFLIAAEDDASFLGCYHDKWLTIDYFADLIALQGRQNERRRQKDMSGIYPRSENDR